MNVIRKILWFALFFGIGGVIGNAVRNDYDGVELTAITTTVIAALILLIEIISGTCRRHETSK